MGGRAESASSWRALRVMAMAVTLAGCGRETAPTPRACPASAPAPEVMPHVGPEATLAYWLAQDPATLDRPWMSADAIAALDRELAARGRGGLGPETLIEAPDAEHMAALVRDRLGALEDQARAGRMTTSEGARLSIAELRDLDAPPELPPFAPEVRVALASVPMHCAPRRAPLLRGDPRFDRNLCSTLEPGEPVQLLLAWPNGLTLARTPYVWGFVDPSVGLSPALTEGDARAMLAAPRVFVPGEHEPLPRIDDRVVRASAEGITRSARPQDAVDLPRALTRRAFLEVAFARLGAPYVWGGDDCSSVVQDVFLAFGLHLPRNSAEQADTGTARIDLGPSDDEARRVRTIVRAGERGIVLLAFPGHVMIYLGTDDEGQPRVLHALAEYVEPCEGGGETLRLVDRVVVSDLTLGARTSRGSLLSRITRVVIFGS